ncbi:signal peptidase I [Pseudoxanthomonas sp. PXM02]|uniref:signal peptidase I n=1 Tax=Pseudoxanthomonas sp. PXM02 TaxID=2769294 RepID=UPI001782793B|nr:signal peptidase I [Pseudoxanthomonas sp. PXM02]MBD9479767.1 signal peptidase I [Pseudoxanthomonas sp. PXM02]
MSRLRRSLVRVLMVLVFLVPTVLVVMYASNPFGVRSMDPRQRVLGHGLYRVPSSSMLPGIVPGQVLVTRAGYYTRHAPQRGDVVSLLPPEREGDVWLQRIVGLPGETVGIIEGRVYIDGVALEEPYVARENVRTDYALTFAPVRVPEGHYFMMGDNRDNSLDSRLQSMTRREDITGKVVARLR